jgi:8-amino-7-oxononanoate synthase
MFEHELASLRKQDLLRQLTVTDEYNGSHVRIDGRRSLLMCSNDYLGLSIHPELKQAAATALERYGTGAGASRLVSGTSSLHEELERRTALFKGTEAALAFNSGYAANTGVIPAIASEGDVILSDSLNHASIIDGCRLSRSAIEVYRHCDCDHLESLLRKRSSARRRLIVTDSVFSMDGDLAPLPDIAGLAEKYDALLMVDDAHATGVLGECGRGSAEHFGILGRVPVQMGTFSKALGSFGAYIAGSRELIALLVNRSRSFLYSTALPAPVCAASLAAFDVIEREPERRLRLIENRKRLGLSLRAYGIPVADSPTPIVPILCGSSTNAVRISRTLFDHDIFASAIRPPTVPEGTSRIRITVLATHAVQDLDQASAVLGSMKRDGLF